MDTKQKRYSGVLLHITSMPGKDISGALNYKNCSEFIDFLASSGQTLWQLNPLGPTGYGDSPYQCFSAFAGNFWVLDIENFVETGIITKDEWKCYTANADYNFVDYGRLTSTKYDMLHTIYKRIIESGKTDILEGLEQFCGEYKWWLNDFAIFMSLKKFFGGKCWREWPEDIRLRHNNALHYYGVKLADDIKFHKFLQFLFFKQWMAVKKYANSKNIKIIGDLPIFVAYDSADVWSNRHNFQINASGDMTSVAGVPPDYFSETGQLWGNPLYNWDSFRCDGFDWWLKRIGYSTYIFDGVRIDHFRGFEACWTIPAAEKTAINGKWVNAPGYDLFNRIFSVMKSPFIIAEDLGLITDEVEKLRDKYNFPGMKILQFAYSDPANVYLPHNFTTSNCVVYTGTHDNDTSLGWFKTLDKESAALLKKYIPDINQSNCCWKLIEAALASSADYAILPLQDILGLDSYARMNTPGAADGNWRWRYHKSALNSNIIEKLNELTKLYNRSFVTDGKKL